MANIYRAVSERAKALHGDEPFEAEFTAAQERDELDGQLEIVPRPYRVLSDNFAAGRKGDVVDLALPVDNEAALFSGGHLKRVDLPKDAPQDAPPKKAAAKKAPAKKSARKSAK